VLGAEHLDTLASAGMLASLLNECGKYEAAEAMHRRVLSGREKLLGLDHYDVFKSLNKSLVLRDRHRYREAEDMSRRAVEGVKKALGPEHPDTLVCLDVLSLILQDQCKYEEAGGRNSEQGLLWRLWPRGV
jgi:hypothetical protein